MSGDYYFTNRYRIKSNRIGGFDYKSGWFFVTICTYDRKYHFGYIENGKMILNEMGKIANQYIIDIPEHFPHVAIDSFIVMPNHIHIILVVDDCNDINDKKNDKKNDRDAKFCVSTTSTTSNTTSTTGNKPSTTGNTQIFGPQSRNLGSIIRGFKIGVKKYATINNVSFQRQTNYYDHIIRDEKSLNTIRTYIANNPKNWNRDRNNNQNLYM